MSMNDREVVESIRQLVLRPQPDQKLVEQLAREFSSLVDRVNQDLARAQRWIRAGLFAEAVSFGDALDLAKTAERLMLEGMFAQWGELCRAAKLAAPSRVDHSLLESYSDAWSRFQSLGPVEAGHRLLSLRRAPLLDRLRVLRELVDLDPRNPEWLRSVIRLQKEASAELTPVAEIALREKDDELSIAVAQVAEACGGGTGEHQEQLARLIAFAKEAKDREAEREAFEACNDMHTAAMGMDFEALKKARERWFAAIARFQPGQELLQSASASLQLLDAQQAREQRERAQQDAINRLELALDQGRSFEEVSQCESSALNAEATVPAQLLLRIAALRDQRQAASRRKLARRITALVMATAALVVGALWFVRWQESIERVESIAREVETMLQAGDPAPAERALSAWKQSNGELSNAPRVAAVSAKVVQALELEKAEIQSAQAAIDRARALATTQASPAEFEQMALELKNLSARAPQSMRQQLLAAADQLTGQAHASRSASMEKARVEFMRLDLELNGLKPFGSDELVDPQAWSRRAAQYQAIVDGAKNAGIAIVNNTDAQSVAQSLQGLAMNASRLRDQSELNAKMHTQARELLRAIEKIPSSETEHRDAYARMLPVSSDLLNREKKLAAYEHGLKAAEGAVGVEAWRTQLVKALIAGRVAATGGLGDVDFGDAGTARSLEPVISKYLLDHPCSPHQESARLMQELCRSTLKSSAAHEGIGAAAAAWLAESGWMNLGEQALDEGRRIYRKRTQRLGDPWEQAVQSKNDLPVSAEKLRPRQPLKGRLLGASSPWPPSLMLADVVAKLPKASWKNARDLWLDLLAKEAALQPGNPILSWHLQRDLWNVWLDFFAQESDPVDAAAAKWVRSLETQRSVAATDPFVSSSGDQAARSEDVRSLALKSLSSMPNITNLVNAARRRDRLMEEGMQPAALVAIALAPVDGSYSVRGIANGKDALIIGKSPDEKWRFFPVRVANNEMLFIQDTPSPIPQSPQLLFMQGASK